MTEIAQNTGSSPSPDFKVQAEALVGDLSYFNGLEDNAKEWLVHTVSEMLKIGDGLEIFETEKKYKLLERYEKYPDMILQLSRGKSISYGDIYNSLTPQWASAASFQAIYDRLAKRRELETGEVKTLLDLGSGYWNSSVAYDSAFPNLEKAIGVEWDLSKKSLFHQRTAACFGLNSNKFQAEGGDFFSLSRNDSELSSKVMPSAPFDLALMQSYFPEGGRTSHAVDEYSEMFRGIGGLLSQGGRLILIVDKRDYEQSRVLNGLKPELEKSFRKYDDTRITPNGHWGMTHTIDIDVWVASKSSLTLD